jgi:YfiH family protein
MRFKLFENYSNLKYGLSIKADGSMKINPAEKADLANREKYFKRSGIENVVSAGIYHEAEAAIVNKSNADKIIYGVDGLVTVDPRLFLTATVADCFPVYFFDPDKNAIGLAHAGWRGIEAGIIANTLKAMAGGFKSIADDILAAVGPGIQKHHFEIQKDILDKFRRYPGFIERSDKIRVDLPGIIKRQILDFGVPDANIEVSEECTFCSKDKYFSFRRDKPEMMEAMIAYIGQN